MTTRRAVLIYNIAIAFRGLRRWLRLRG